MPLQLIKDGRLAAEWIGKATIFGPRSGAVPAISRPS
jgi:hypothetical protein